MKVYTEQEYLEIWDGLSEEAQQDLINAIEGCGVGLPSDGLEDKELITVDSALVFNATHHGMNAYRMGQPNIVGASDPPDSSIPQPLNELAEARERIRELEAAVNRLLEIARLAQFYAPGELGEFPEKMAADIEYAESTLKGGERKA